MKSFLSIPENEVFTSEIVINKSRFLGFAKYIKTTEQAEEFLSFLREKYNDARHICFAYQLENTAKLSDDGEPSGTAGKPIFSLLEKKKLNNVIVAVVRYFGGVKLGAGGLLRAYTNTASEVLDKAGVVEWSSAKIYQITMDYKDYQPFLNKIKNRNIAIIDTNFDNGAVVKIVARDDEIIENALFLGETTKAF